MLLAVKCLKLLFLLSNYLLHGKVNCEPPKNSNFQNVSSKASHYQQYDHQHFVSSYNSGEWSFSYTVEDAKSNLYMTHKERKTDKGIIGQYEVKLPDGRVQIVNYEADSNGYKPVVKYRLPMTEHSNDDFSFYDRSASESHAKPELLYGNLKSSFSSPDVNGEKRFPFWNAGHFQRESIEQKKMTSDLVHLQEELPLKPTKTFKERENQNFPKVLENISPEIQSFTNKRINKIPSKNKNLKHEIDYGRSKDKTKISKSTFQDPVISVPAVKKDQAFRVSVLSAENFDSGEKDENSERNIFSSTNGYLPNTGNENDHIGYTNNILGGSLIPHILRYRVYIPY